MDSKKVGRKAQKILGPGHLYSNEGVTEWFWEKHEDGSVVRLGSTLSEAWRNLDRIANDLQADSK